MNETFNTNSTIGGLAIALMGLGAILAVFGLKLFMLDSDVTRKRKAIILFILASLISLGIVGWFAIPSSSIVPTLSNQQKHSGVRMFVRISLWRKQEGFMPGLSKIEQIYRVV